MVMELFLYKKKKSIIIFVFFSLIFQFQLTYTSENIMKSEENKDKGLEVLNQMEDVGEDPELDEILLSFGIKVKKLEKKGFLIEEVIPNSSAEKAGLKVNDIILEIDGLSFSKKETLVKKLQFEKIKFPKSILIIRDGNEKKLGWPFLDSSLLTEEEYKKILLFDSSGKNKLKNYDYISAIKDFEKALDVSIHYPERDRLFYQIILGYFSYLLNRYYINLTELNKIKVLVDFVENSPVNVETPYEIIISQYKNSLREVKLNELEYIFKNFLTFKKDCLFIIEKIFQYKNYAEIELARKNLDDIPDNKILENIYNEFSNIFSELKKLKKTLFLNNLWIKDIENEISVMKIRLNIYTNLIEELINLCDFKRYIKLNAYSYWDGEPPLKRICSRKFSIPETEVQTRIVEIFGKYLSESPAPFYTPNCELYLINRGKYDFVGKVVSLLLDANKNIREKKEIPIEIAKGKRYDLFIQFINIPTDEILEMKCVFGGLGRIAPQYKFYTKDWRVHFYIIDMFSNEVDFGEYYINQ